MVVTISDKQHTEVVVEQALELGVPVLPIPDAGGDSRDLLVKYRERIGASFDPGALDRCLDDVSKAIISNPDRGLPARSLTSFELRKLGGAWSCSHTITNTTLYIRH